MECDLVFSPRYYYSANDPELYQYLLTQPHRKRHFDSGDFLWKPGEFIERIYYICSGVAVSFVEHETGRRKIFLFAGNGSIYPGCHTMQFKIEQSILTQAITPMETLEFRREDFYRMFQMNTRLNAFMFESYAMYINLLLYETAHQGYNDSFVKLCNLLYLFAQNRSQNTVELTQENLADILAVNRVNVAKHLAVLREKGILQSHRKSLKILDMQALEALCSIETQP